jgi:hypothetical protein
MLGAMLALLAACTSATDSAAPGLHAGGDTAEATDSGQGTTDTASDVATCQLPGDDNVDPSAPQQFTFALAVTTTNGEALDDGGGSGLASLSANGVLGWDLAPASTVTTTATADGFTGFYGRTADGDTPSGCPVVVVERWDLVATWADGGGFTGTLHLVYSEDVCETRCRADVEYAVTATPR